MERLPVQKCIQRHEARFPIRHDHLDRTREGRTLGPRVVPPEVCQERGCDPRYQLKAKRNAYERKRGKILPIDHRGERKSDYRRSPSKARSRTNRCSSARHWRYRIFGGIRHRSRILGIVLGGEEGEEGLGTLCNLPGFVVASEDGDSMGVSNFERDEEGDGLDGVVATIDVIAHEEVVGVGSFAADSRERLEGKKVGEDTGIIP